MTSEDRDQYEQRSRVSLRAKAAELADLFRTASDEWGYEDPVYRFYHQSFKVYALQGGTRKIVDALQ